MKNTAADRRTAWNWSVFALGVIAFVPIALGGWHHPPEINLASYAVWSILSGTLLYSARAQGFTGWVLLLAYFLGDFAITAMMAAVGGGTFNLGAEEAIVIGGMTATFSVWTVVGKMTGRWSPRILFLGGIMAEFISYYPQAKQYYGPHETPTVLGLLGWGMWVSAGLLNLCMAERLPSKLAAIAAGQPDGSQCWIGLVVTFEESAFTITSTAAMAAILVLMIR